MPLAHRSGPRRESIDVAIDASAQYRLALFPSEEYAFAHHPALFVLLSESEHLPRILACQTGYLGKSFATAV
jgi:hypothetical protein